MDRRTYQNFIFALYGTLVDIHTEEDRPEVWQGRAVPGVLLTGHHANIEKWRAQQSLERTRTRRPDLYAAWQARGPRK